MENISTVSEKNAASSEEVSASTREMLARLADVRQIAQTVESMSQDEQQLLAKFNLGANGNAPEKA
jgi:methyl-accepting chemotaxis protein